MNIKVKGLLTACALLIAATACEAQNRHSWSWLGDIGSAPYMVPLYAAAERNKACLAQCAHVAWRNEVIHVNRTPGAAQVLRYHSTRLETPPLNKPLLACRMKCRMDLMHATSYAGEMGNIIADIPHS